MLGAALVHGTLTTSVQRAQVVGVLKGYDALLNLVLDEAHEYLKVRPSTGTRPAFVQDWTEHTATRVAGPGGPVQAVGRDTADGADGAHQPRPPDGRT